MRAALLTFSLSPSLFRGGSRLTGFCFGLRAFRGGKEAHRVRFREESCALRVTPWNNTGYGSRYLLRHVEYPMAVHAVLPCGRGSNAHGLVSLLADAAIAVPVNTGVVGYQHCLGGRVEEHDALEGECGHGSGVPLEVVGRRHGIGRVAHA